MLRRQIGAALVGECLEAPRAVGGGLVKQRTAGGLLVWDGRTNIVAFTDGSRTWVSGPNGVETRPNHELLAWVEEAIRAARAREITPRRLALLYVETVRGNTEVPLEQIYVAAYGLAERRALAWLEQTRSSAARALATGHERLRIWATLVMHGRIGVVAAG